MLPADGRLDRGASGTVETFSICHVTWDMRPLDEPQIPAVIRLDGTSEGGFLHLLGEVAPDDVRAGMQVEAVWKPAGERVGSILDIEYFRPLEPELRRELVAIAAVERPVELFCEPDQDPRRARGLVPVHRRGRQHGVLRSPAGSWRVPRIAVR